MKKQTLKKSTLKVNNVNKPDEAKSPGFTMFPVER